MRHRLIAIWRRLLRSVPGIGIVVRAAKNYIEHQSANQAGSVAFSMVLAMFPLLILVASISAFVGDPGAASRLAGRVLDYAPSAVDQVLRPVVMDVLRVRNRGLVAIGVVFTVWAASSGTQAIRSAVNRAYGVQRGLSFLKARVKVILFTIIGAIGTIFVFGSVIVTPYAWQLVNKTTGGGREALGLWGVVRYGLAMVVLIPMYSLIYGWLPDVRQQVRTVLPGAVVGAFLWVAAALALSYTLRSAARLTLVYGSFAGLVATLVFLYVSAATLIFGAEINGVIMERDNRMRASGAGAKGS